MYKSFQDILLPMVSDSVRNAKEKEDSPGLLIDTA